MASLPGLAFLCAVFIATVRFSSQTSRLPGYIHNPPLPDPVLNSNTVCKNTPSLNKEQMKLCRQAPEVIASALQGIQVAIRECQYQLRYRRWNCSTLEGKTRNLKAVGLLAGGFRETAFVYSIISAGVVRAAATSCSLGKLSSCGCDESVKGEGRGWKWGGCSDNIVFGSKFATKFLDSREKGSDIKSEMNVHNNRVGRLAVEQTIKTRCKCQGVSASCSVKTCWKAVSPFREVSDVLMEKYDYAIMVKTSNRNRGASTKLRRYRRKFKQDLIFFEESPNYCEPNRILGTAGTKGRVCTAETLDTDSCQSLCCGRGYVEMNVTIVRRCQCHYNWCCYTFCEKCYESGVQLVCK